MPYTAILFDFGQVICSFDLARLVANLAGVAGRPVEEVHGMMKGLSRLAVAYECGDLSTDAFYKEVTRSTGMTMEREAFRHAYCDIFTPIPGTFALIRALRPSYRLGLVSNTSEWHFEYGIRPVDVFPLFDTVTLSYEVGAMKPDERVYRDALTKLGVAARECVYIDDLAENVAAAARLGMTAFQFRGHDSLIRELRAAGVRVDGL